MTIIVTVAGAPPPGCEPTASWVVNTLHLPVLQVHDRAQAPADEPLNLDERTLWIEHPYRPEFNLVILNGRQIPTALLTNGGGEPPSSRSFDFATLAAEGIAAVEVYKTGRASVSSGGIGSRSGSFPSYIRERGSTSIR